MRDCLLFEKKEIKKERFCVSEMSDLQGELDGKDEKRVWKKRIEKIWNCGG